MVLQADLEYLGTPDRSGVSLALQTDLEFPWHSRQIWSFLGTLGGSGVSLALQTSEISWALPTSEVSWGLQTDLNSVLIGCRSVVYGTGCFCGWRCLKCISSCIDLAVPTAAPLISTLLFRGGRLSTPPSPYAPSFSGRACISPRHSCWEWLIMVSQ